MTAKNKKQTKWHNNYTTLNRSQTAREQDKDTNRDSGRKTRNGKDRDTAIIYLFIFKYKDKETKEDLADRWRETETGKEGRRVAKLTKKTNNKKNKEQKQYSWKEGCGTAK